MKKTIPIFISLLFGLSTANVYASESTNTLENESDQYLNLTSDESLISEEELATSDENSVDLAGVDFLTQLEESQTESELIEPDDNVDQVTTPSQEEPDQSDQADQVLASDNNESPQEISVEEPVTEGSDQAQTTNEESSEDESLDELVVEDEPDYSLVEVDVDLLYEFASQKPDKLHRLLVVAQELETGHAGQTLLDELSELVVDEDITDDVLTELVKFLNIAGQVESQKAPIKTSPIQSNYTPNPNAKGLNRSASANGDDKNAQLKEVLDKISSTTQSTLGLINSLKQSGTYQGGSIGQIIDNLIPNPIGFGRLGGIIQQIAELKANVIREDVSMGTGIAAAVGELFVDLEFNGTPVNYVVGKLSNMAYDIGMSVADGVVRFWYPSSFYNPNTYALRGRLLGNSFKAIKIATTEWRAKPQVVHSKIGLEIAHAWMAAVDPYSDVNRLTRRIDDLLATLEFGNNYRDLTATDIATTYVKELLDEAIWDIRVKRDQNILGKVPFGVYNDLNKAITNAVGVQLNPEAKVYEIFPTVEKLKQAYDRAINYFTLTKYEDCYADDKKKKELSDFIWQVRQVRDSEILGRGVSDHYTKINELLTEAVGLQLNLTSTNGQVDDIITRLKDSIQKARQAISQYTVRDAKRDLSDFIWQVRRIRDSQLLGKVSFNQYNRLNQAITKAVGVQLSLKTSVQEALEAISNLKEVLGQVQATLV